MKLLEYNLGNGVIAFSTTREGGVSNTAYSTFSICHYCGDDEANVRANRNTLCQHLGIANTHLILPHQTHSTNVHRITQTDIDTPSALTDIDALITNLTNCCIGVSTADCVPILLHDPISKSIAAIHAGWRGTVNKITERTIKAMFQAFNANPQNINAIIGPSISEEAFEVGNEVYDAFNQAGFDMTHIAHRYSTNDGGEKWHINLWRANQDILVANGIPAKQIHISGICTYTNHQTYFSARRLGIRSGRIFTGIMLTP